MDTVWIELDWWFTRGHRYEEFIEDDNDNYEDDDNDNDESERYVVSFIVS